MQSSWKLDRADRAEVARLSHIIETLPVLEANRQQEEAAALGRRLFSDRNGSGSLKLQSQILEALLPGRKSQTSRPLDVLDHAGAIVRRLESTGPGCQWMLDRWIELRAILDQGQTWPSIEKSRAIRLLGKPPLNLTAEEWENHCERRRANPHPEIDGYLARKLDRQLVEGLAQDQAATIEELRSVAEQAIARLEPLTAEHRQRAEADVARQAALLSFDTSTEGERLRRYHFSCSRALFRSLDTLLKVRRSGSRARSGIRTESSEEAPPLSDEPESDAPTRDGTPPCPSDDLASCLCEIPADTQAVGGFTADTAEGRGSEAGEFDPAVTGGIADPTVEVDPRPMTIDRENLQYEPTTPSADHATRQDEPTSPQVALTARSTLPFHRTVVLAMILVILSGSVARNHRSSQNEPTAITADHQNRQNEAISAPRRVVPFDADAVGEPPGLPWRSIRERLRPGGLDHGHPDEPITTERGRRDRAISTSQHALFTSRASPSRKGTIPRVTYQQTSPIACRDAGSQSGQPPRGGYCTPMLCYSGY